MAEGGIVARTAPFDSVTTVLLALALAGLLQGCTATIGPGGSTGKQDAGILWPPSPSVPRIRYVSQVVCGKDLGAHSGVFKSLLTLLVGQRTEDNFFVRPMSIAISDRGSICVADPGARAVFVYDQTRSTFQCFRSMGNTKLISPVAVAWVESQNAFLVADSAVGQVFAFTIRGRLLFKLSDGLEQPTGLAVSAGKMFVADSKQNQIFVFDVHGNQTARIGARGSGTGEFNGPTFMATDEAGCLYVTDTLNFRVQVFDPAGRFLRVIGKQGDTSGRFSRPKGVATDSFGHVYVTDGLFDNIQVFDRDGHFLLNWGQAGSNAGEFWLPAGVAVSRDNSIYVADSYNHRLQVFKYVGND